MFFRDLIIVANNIEYFFNVYLRNLWPESSDVSVCLFHVFIASPKLLKNSWTKM